MNTHYAFSRVSSPGLALALAALLLTGPSLPAAGGKPSTAAELFGFAKIWDVEIRISEEAYRALAPTQGRGFDRDYPYAEGQVAIAGHLPLKVGLRYKGNSSYSSASGTKKKSFKVDFNRVIADQEFLGMTKLNLNNNILDPSQARETLAFQMFTDMGLPSCRTAFARVYLQVGKDKKNEYLGLYTMVEQVNSAFLKGRFGTGKGLLLKPERNNSFPYLGERWKDYESSYVPKTETSPEFHTRLMEFSRFVEESDDKEFAENIAGYVDISELMKFTALHAVLSHLDSFLLRGHNFYIYLPRSDGKFHWLPWDVNSTFAGHRSAGSAAQQMNLSIAQPYTDSVKLLGRIMKIKAARVEYEKQVGSVLAGPFKPELLRSRLSRIEETIRAAVAKDRNTNFARFQANYTEPEEKSGSDSEDSRGPVRDGARSGLQQKPLLNAFIAKRTASILAQLSAGAEGYIPRASTRRSRGGRGERPEENSRRPSRSPFPRRTPPGN